MPTCPLVLQWTSKDTARNGRRDHCSRQKAPAAGPADRHEAQSTVWQHRNSGSSGHFRLYRVLSTLLLQLHRYSCTMMLLLAWRRAPDACFASSGPKSRLACASCMRCSMYSFSVAAHHNASIYIYICQVNCKSSRPICVHKSSSHSKKNMKHYGLFSKIQILSPGALSHLWLQPCCWRDRAVVTSAGSSCRRC